MAEQQRIRLRLQKTSGSYNNSAFKLREQANDSCQPTKYSIERQLELVDWLV